ncbi:hypothetical protein IQ276_009390 [Desmonostoc muscorum LEGE 12446]|uniref:NACHT domain-containing protein n=1 Tax=Desmonostoc muscorum LEGE 12446 TaxID=1828758 RepID=A0A8J7DA33_DESMC|nr:hypothetical protein [Desmonostoc muscorum]MCF2146660.1 hypothetical protein [Desmonostoc muscorum LEGE 12446]
MPDSYDLTQLDPNTFEHLVNHLALRALGLGLTGFSPGSDGGRDGYFEGEAPYPSETDRWSGCWYLQSKFHKPNLSKDSQKWLLNQIQAELKEFKNPESGRKLPDNWIVATNIDPSGVPETGAFDKARELVANEFPELKDNFHIWGGRKILDLLILNPEISDHYRHFLTPGNILTEIFNQLKDAQAEAKTILRFLILSQLDDQQYTKLEQAGSAGESPGIHQLFVDLPFRCHKYNCQDLVMPWLVKTSARCHRIDEQQPDTKDWQIWSKHPSRARVWFIKGGPGQGKSTITQFFCQIQRAALIVNKDISQIPTKQKTLASEIRKATEKNGFWPTVPRIPISIELKEFAQWFGEQERNKPRGILTYLAYFISGGIEQQVHVGTLKRLLGNRSWAIIFDGLDEVPQDVKDAVATEVCRFVNDVAVEINADFLTLCTSRPQGYSGQFEDLDGPTIELINLSPQQAIECAKPVLELNRSPSEAKKALQILISAIQSPAVRELMTTPLQSHIMAIVVRGGEKPPERRWKLFTNFYQVIRKREANRNLLDKRLAKLLSEEEQLLKTVHNRLGFVLHARAELSKGAQTKLDRNHEFKKLITDAVSQMVETEIDETVDVLMQATTDRLVLVSTPVDGNYVRFDIRPLQEFFAAEFIYESVSAEELRERVELIAGDAHWREVMHFLLSALVENGRRTELAVVVAVLENFNEGDDENLRLLKRRLGRGAILAARLLQEGVLEQDKRIRQQFRKCLEPLTASLEIELLYPLIQVSRPNSQSWLYSFLISCLHDKNLTESVGAAIVLVNILPDNHEKVEEVSNFIIASPSDYISCVLTSNLLTRDGKMGRQSNPVKHWVLTTIVKIILSLKWASLTKQAFESCIEILNFNIENSCNIASDMGLSSNQLNCFQILLESQKYIFPNNKNKNIRDYSIVEIFDSQLNWREKKYELNVLNDFGNTPKILQLIYLIVRYSQEKQRSILAQIISLFSDEGEHLFNTVLSNLGIGILVNTSKSETEKKQYLNNMEYQYFEKLFDNKDIELSFVQRQQMVIRKTRKRFSIDLWKNLVDEYTFAAIFLWRNEEVVNNLEILNIILNKIVQNPKILCAYPGIWGRFIKEAPEREHELRTAFLLASLEPICEDTSLLDFSSFKINLPLEAPLLPHIINFLLNSFINHRNAYRSRRVDEDLEVISKIIYEMIHETSYLSQIYQNLSLAQNIRAAAMIALLLHPDGTRDFLNFKHQIVEFYNPEVGTWYVKAITSCLCLLTKEEDTAAKWIVSNLLEAARTDYEGRQYIQKLLTLWRESSSTPIQKANVQEKWLSGA